MTVLTDQLQIAYKQGKQDGKNELKIATDSRGGNQWDDMSGYGSDWPGTMKDQMDEPGTDPAEVFEQLELPLDTVERLKELMIAGDPSFTVGGSKGSSRNKKIMSSGDANAPNAKEFMEKLQLGPAMFPINKVDAKGLTDVLSPHQNPRSGSLKDSGLTDEQKIKLLIRGAAAYKA